MMTSLVLAGMFFCLNSRSAPPDKPALGQMAMAPISERTVAYLATLRRLSEDTETRGAPETARTLVALLSKIQEELAWQKRNSSFEPEPVGANAAPRLSVEKLKELEEEASDIFFAVAPDKKTLAESSLNAGVIESPQLSNLCIRESRLASWLEGLKSENVRTRALIIRRLSFCPDEYSLRAKAIVLRVLLDRLVNETKVTVKEEAIVSIGVFGVQGAYLKASVPVLINAISDRRLAIPALNTLTRLPSGSLGPALSALHAKIDLVSPDELIPLLRCVRWHDRTQSAEINRRVAGILDDPDYAAQAQYAPIREYILHFLSDRESLAPDLKEKFREDWAVVQTQQERIFKLVKSENLEEIVLELKKGTFFNRVPIFLLREFTDHRDLINSISFMGVPLERQDALALLKATEYSHVEAIQYLLDRGVNLNTAGAAVLTMAAKRSNFELLKFLVSRGADPALNVGAVAEAAYARRPEMVDYLIEHGADINADRGWALRLLGSAKVFEQLEDMYAFLISRKADVNAGDGAPLVEACEAGNEVAVKMLLRAGAKLNVRNGKPLAIAAERGNYPLVSALVAAGAEVTLNGGEALVWLAKNGNLNGVKLMLARGLSANLKQGAPLIAAAGAGHLQIVEQLLDHGADPSARDHESLVVAARGGFEGIVERLLRAGANVDAREGAALYAAVKQGQRMMVARLIREKIDLVKFGKTAIDIALAEKDFEMAKILRDALADRSNPPG